MKFRTQVIVIFGGVIALSVSTTLLLLAYEHVHHIRHCADNDPILVFFHMQDRPGTAALYSVTSGLIGLMITSYWAAKRDILNRAVRSWQRRQERQADRRMTSPPCACEFLLWLFAKPRQRDAVVGDFAEVFAGNVEKHGCRQARWLYRWDVFRSTGPLILSLVERLVSGTLRLVGGFWS